MHLKRVELENFKSFGRKLSIPFLEGFTAITGPNGSGKSNVGDAVLFVLGPKSNKAIRAGKLTDLIFNGGKEKKPADRCQVSLVFDNVDRTIPVDSDEVTLTRLVKLSKSDPENYYSYFYVNGRPSSLGEFDSLLAQSRISADGYNIVRQGDILRIVEMTPLQRRAIVDEIAGITKFDADIERANAERKTVEANLERVRIILAEIEAQLHTLERERAQALRYKAVKDEFDLARVKHAKRRHDVLSSELTTLHQVIASEEAALVDMDKALAMAGGRLSDVAAQMAAVQRKIVERAGPEAQELKVKIEEIKKVSMQALMRLNYAQQEIEELKRLRGESQGDLKRQEKELAKYAKERDGLAGQRSAADTDLATREGRLAALRDRVSASQGRSADINRELAELRLRHDKAEVELHETRLSLERAQDRKARLATLLADTEEARDTQRMELGFVEKDERDLAAPAAQGEPEALRKEQFALKKREAALTQELRELGDAIRRLQNEYTLLKASQDANEKVASGYNRAVSAVLSARDQGQLRGIHGTIAELAQVDSKHTVAMEVAAGAGRMQAIVTETDADAAEAIDYLKRNKLGRATFLPLNKMVPGRPAGKPLMAVRAPEAEGFAIDLIRFDEKYRNAFWYVFRDTVVVKSLDAARRLMGGVRLVTLDGDLIDAGGAMTGGDRESATSKIKFGAGEAAQFEKVRKDLQGAIAHQEALSRELSEVRARLDDLEGTLREASTAQAVRAAKKADLERRRAEAQTRLDALLAQEGEARRELLAVAAEIADHEKGVARLTAALAAMVGERDEKAKLLFSVTPKDLARELEREEREASEAREKVRDLGARLATAEHSLQLVTERRDEIARRLAEIETRLVDEEEAVKANAAISREKEQELAVLLALDAQHNEAVRELNAEHERLREAHGAAKEEAERLRVGRNAKSDLILTQRGRVPLVEAQMAEVAQELAGYSVPAPAVVTESVEELRARVRQLENQLDRFESVNMNALEEYDRQAKRKDELTAETQRLETERADLITLVDEIVARKKEGFFKVFDEIAQNFSKVYERLSNGGRAELLLEDPEQPFNGGLTMRAQPPGKKVTRLEALSGGEKSLTSMAFIFAIQEFEPSPFYYLDEVDQNLDGVNSELLAKMVKAESKHAQFIVVSLRKVTLKEADHVYGVTMMESGLSEMVGEVRISELADEPPQAPEAR